LNRVSDAIVSRSARAIAAERNPHARSLAGFHVASFARHGTARIYGLDGAHGES